MDLVAGFSTAGMFLVVVAGVLAFFLPFYVMGIYNEAKNHGESNPGFWRERPETFTNRHAVSNKFSIA